MIDGIIIKGVGGFYYVKTDTSIIECRARGLFREENLKPLIGDNVKIKISTEDKSGYIVEIKPRKTQLTRPAVANITQGIIVMSVENPNINMWLLDKFLLMIKYENLQALICINKFDLNETKALMIKKIYEDAGYNTIVMSTKSGLGIDELEEHLKGNISIFAGPSGAGKSTILNAINPLLSLQTGAVSKKTGRGRHTTRHTELLELGDDTFVLDSPGFSSLNLDFIVDETEVRHYFKEINKYGKDCSFQSCLHDREPNCAVKQLVDKNIISQERYNNYILLLNEVRETKRY